MKYTTKTTTGFLLHDCGIASKTLDKTRILIVSYIPVPAFTLPLLLWNPVILISSRRLKLNKDNEIMDKKSLALLLYQYCHAHQVLEWGPYNYIWRHFFHRVFFRNTPIKHSHVERECYASVDKLMGSEINFNT